MLAAAAVTLNSCTENIDESDLYTFTGEMMVDHFENNPETFSSYLTLLGQVHPSKKSASTMKELLAARGNYTCFAPTNEAIAIYLDSLLHLEEPQVSSTNINEVPDSVAQDIVFNTLIENGNDEAFPTTSFSEGPLSSTNMNDRYVSISYGVDEDKNTITYVNVKSKIIDGDIEVENGYIHTIDRVLAPSNAGIADVIMITENTQFFGKLLSITGWDKKLNKCKDEWWEETYDDIRGEEHTFNGWTGKYPEHRYIKYTAFVEPDSVFEANGITDIPSLTKWLEANAYYGEETSWGNDYENEDNAINQFVSYHLLPEDLTYNNMVTYANEYGRSASTMQQQKDKLSETFYVNVWEYWETLGKQRRSIKITGLRGGEKRINRKSVYNLASTYRERPSEITIPGIKVNATNGDFDNDTFNGHYYPIDDILVWNQDVPNKVLNERMRYDITSMFPEFLTNNIRQNRKTEDCASGYWYFNLDYLDNLVDMTKETEFIYLPNQGYSGGAGSWMNYQIDEFNIRGAVDFTMKLPPVPYTGTYEIRYGINSNNNRGMAQIYFGKNWRNLPAIGIPLDLRESAIPTSTTGWKKDSEIGDEDAINEADKNMRNLGYMKAPKYMQIGGETGRDVDHRCLRKIIYTGQLEAGETYYIRFKSVLNGTAFEFFFDYLEFVPKAIYAGDEAEDKW